MNYLLLFLTLCHLTFNYRSMVLWCNCSIPAFSVTFITNKLKFIPLPCLLGVVEEQFFHFSKQLFLSREVSMVAASGQLSRIHKKFLLDRNKTSDINNMHLNTWNYINYINYITLFCFSFKELFYFLFFSHWRKLSFAHLSFPC